MRHIYFSLLTLLYTSSFVTAAQATHLKTLGLRALHTSAALSTWRYREFPKINPYLFVVTHHAEKNQDGITRFQHAARPFNNGKGILLAASSYQETSPQEKRLNIAQSLLQSIDINPLKKLIEWQENDIFYPAIGVTDTLCADVKLINTAISSPVEGMVVAAFCHLKKHSKKEYEDIMFVYSIASDNYNTIMIQSRGIDEEEEDYDIIGKIDYFYGLQQNRLYSNGWLVTAEGCRIEHDAMQCFRMQLKCGFGGGQNGYRHFIQDFAKKQIPDDKDARLIVLDRYGLQKAIQGDN